MFSWNTKFSACLLKKTIEDSTVVQMFMKNANFLAQLVALEKQTKNAVWMISTNTTFSACFLKKTIQD